MLNTLSRKGFLLFWLVSAFTVAAIDLLVIFAVSYYDNSPVISAALEQTQRMAEKSDAPPAVSVKSPARSRKSSLRNMDNTHWQAGLDAFHKSDMQSACDHFAAILSENDALSSSDRAAVAFWAYRAFSAVGEKTSAAHYLDLAANEEPGFYSIIARHISGKETIAPNVQISMALEYATRKSSNALYPMPNWTPASGYQVEQALLFAIVRQESQFNPNALSPVGALGVMQLMPGTAHAMARNIRVFGSVGEPAVSMALGQQYIKRLMEMNSIRNNLVFLLAAYNAGPGMLEKWQDDIAYKEDPLLFIESIPYGATRDYVVNVIGNYWVYSELFGSANSSLSMISQGQWPLYSGTIRQIASAKTLAGVD